ncbi:MAG: VOC family protein [Nitrososphaeraceae archaeon]
MNATVKAIPEGHHTITPYLVVKNGAQAIEFYKKAFSAEECFRMNGPDGKSIGHAQLKIGDSLFMLTDEFPQMNSLSPESIGGSPVSMYVYVEDVDAVFNQAVSAGATVLNPVMDMFYGDRWGYIKDPFGHLWSIATHKKDLTPDELKKAAEIAFAEMSRKTKE